MDFPHQTLWAPALHAALGACTQAADAYAQAALVVPVPLWAVLIAAGLVGLEWVLARSARS